jgi:2-polyprenyl-3-methyl-5-hydroxy-6-metoxy-1,4-benzoquinol methylase
MVKDRQEECCPVCGEKLFSAFAAKSIYLRLVRCVACGHVYRNPAPSEEELSEIYKSYHNFKKNKFYNENIEEWFKDPDGQYQYAINFVNKRGGFYGKSVLDVGCGSGRFLFECRKYGALITGVDPHPQAVNFAREHFDIEVVPKDIEQAVQEGIILASSFDFIFAFEILEHIKKPVVFLSLLNRLLLPGGLVFVSTPNFQFERLLRTVDQIAEEYPEHSNFFEPVSLINCLARYDFQVVEAATVCNYTYGERQKQILSRNSFINSLWKKVRRNVFLHAAKDIFFKILDIYKQPIDARGLNGSHLICIVQNSGPRPKNDLRR